MNNNGRNGKNETEMLLKQRMDELASNVDCFDRIAARAFPEDEPDEVYIDGGDIIRDLENVTGRSNTRKFRRLAAAAAVLLIVGIVPKTAIVNYFLDNAGNKASKRKYSDILSIVLDEKKMSGYEVFDVPLEYYIKNDVLVTPMYSCPFEMTDECEDPRVRVFVRTYGDIMTNQMYAVEYSGEYKKENIIAAAESGAEFMDGELKAADFVDNSAKRAETVSDVFTCSADSGLMYYGGSEVTNIGGFSSDIYFKESGGDILALNNDVLFFSMDMEDGSHKFCDFLTEYYDESGAVAEWDHGKCSWETSLYYNGEDAYSEVDSSDFSRTKIYCVQGSHGSSIAYVEPYNYARNDDGTAEIDGKSFTADEFDRYEVADEDIRVILRRYSYFSNRQTTWLTEYNYNVPADKRTRSTFASYFSHYEIDSVRSNSSDSMDVYVKNGRSMQMTFKIIDPSRISNYYTMSWFMENGNWVREYIFGDMTFEGIYSEMQDIMLELIEYGLPSDYPDLYDEEAGQLSPVIDGEYDEEKAARYNEVENQRRMLVNNFMGCYIRIEPLVSTTDEKERLDELMSLAELYDYFWVFCDPDADESEYRAAAEEFIANVKNN